MKAWFNPQAIYVLWLREMKRYLRARSRIIGSLGMPFFFLIFLGTGFKQFRPAGVPDHVDYLQYLAPGMLAVVLQFGSMFTGMAILWDRQFGFLKEIMVAPVSRVAIVLGRTLGGMTTAFLQGVLFLAVACIAGLQLPGLSGWALVPLFMLLIAASFVNVGIAVASVMHDMQGFGLVMNFLMIPLFLLSGALFPIENFPEWVQVLALADPLLYGVDGMRFGLLGVSRFSPVLDGLILCAFCTALVITGAFLFSRVDVE
ncbi:MAG: ABC transporter permease [Desulfobacterota bacterium]|nr:ABC transporter permease [Thermodesulfobacteriota bacterium]